jgi:hypothetical protein
LAATEQPLAGFSAQISERDTLAAKPRQLVGPSRKTPATLQRGSYFTGDPYIHWVSTQGHETPKTRMATYYVPLWLDIEPTMQRFLGNKP